MFINVQNVAKHLLNPCFSIFILFPLPVNMCALSFVPFMSLVYRALHFVESIWSISITKLLTKPLETEHWKSNWNQTIFPSPRLKGSRFLDMDEDVERMQTLGKVTAFLHYLSSSLLMLQVLSFWSRKVILFCRLKNSTPEKVTKSFFNRTVKYILFLFDSLAPCTGKVVGCLPGRPHLKPWRWSSKDLI